ncbi:MAG: 6-carboxytetrahydropterin synthase [Planctomycetota bacterium]|nr:6-carboxytetrahydropterin synthase [Planctomycetota bacterium]
MFQIEVNHRFSAAHRVSVGGVMEELHGHDWRVTVVVEGPTLDQEDLLVDFHAVETALRAAVEPFSGRTMNGTPPFDRVHPTAERVAEHVGTLVSPAVPEGRRVVSVAVEEAPGCIARWIPGDKVGSFTD